MHITVEAEEYSLVEELADYTLVAAVVSFIVLLVTPAVTLHGSLSGQIGFTGYRVEALGSQWRVPFLDNMLLYTVPMLVAEVINVYYISFRLRGLPRGVEEWGSLLIINLANAGYTLGIYRGLSSTVSSIPTVFVYDTSAGHIVYPPGVIEWNKIWLLAFWIYVGTSILTALIITYPTARSLARELQRKIRRRG